MEIGMQPRFVQRQTLKRNVDRVPAAVPQLSIAPMSPVDGMEIMSSNQPHC